MSLYTHGRRALIGVCSIALVVALAACAPAIGTDPDSPAMKKLRAATTKHMNLVTSLTVPQGMTRLSESVIDSCGIVSVKAGSNGPTHCEIARADVYSVDVPGDATVNAQVVDDLFDSSGFQAPITLVGSPELAQILKGKKSIASTMTNVSGISVRAQFMPSDMPKDLLALRLLSLPRHSGNILKSTGATAKERIATTQATKAPYLVVIDFSEDYYNSNGIIAPGK